MTTIFALWMLFQQVYSQSDFVQISGTSVQARYDAAIAQARRGSDETFWIAYRFPVRPGIRVTTMDNNVMISSRTTSDGIEWIPTDGTPERVGVFLLVGKSDGVLQKTRLINLNDNFRIHDRKVYWLGEPNAEESLTLLERLIRNSPQATAASLARDMTLHDSPNVADHLLRLARATDLSTPVRANLVTL